MELTMCLHAFTFTNTRLPISQEFIHECTIKQNAFIFQELLISLTDFIKKLYTLKALLVSLRT